MSAAVATLPGSPAPVKCGTDRLTGRVKQVVGRDTARDTKGRCQVQVSITYIPINLATLFTTFRFLSRDRTVTSHLRISERLMTIRFSFKGHGFSKPK